MNPKLSRNLVGTYFCVLTLLISSSHLSAQCRKLVWADEFNKASAQVSRTNWSFGSGNNYDCLHYFTDRPENATVSNGTLKIIAREEPYMGFDYTSALLFRKDKIGWRYGRIEASIKLPSTPGFVPAFWMMPSDDMYGWWPNSGEIDIMEYVTTNPNLTHGGVHFSAGNTPGTTSVPDAETAFHVYAIEWTEEQMEFYVDDTNFVTVYNDHTGSEYWPFDQPFYVILNLAVGGSWCGPPTEETIFPAIMEVDYVRAYQDLEDITISGNGFIPYDSENVVYSVPDIEDATYSWSVSGHGNIVSGQNSHEIDVNWDCFGGEVVAEVESGFCTQSIEYPVFVTSNYLMNPGFEKGVKYWTSRVNYLLTASMRLTTEEAHNGDASIDVNVQTLGNNPWDIQLSQQVLIIETGKQYEISFWAKADGNDRRMSTTVINTETYFVYGGESFTLTTDWSKYAFQFTPSVSADVALNIDLGLTTGQFYLDDIVFTTPELSS
ncbi:family 16 glycosylhydrolase, partial [candidate division KSB1 bacterium]|nr:family 16 glycosylhydrolase [candidate division KSB1 bacterium]